MGHRVRIYASKKWQLCLTLGGDDGRRDAATLVTASPTLADAPVAGAGPSLRMIWPQPDTQAKGKGRSGGSTT